MRVDFYVELLVGGAEKKPEGMEEAHFCGPPFFWGRIVWEILGEFLEKTLGFQLLQKWKRSTGWWFQIFLEFSPLFGEMIQFD